MAYTSKATTSGTYEVFDPAGARIGTGTQDWANTYLANNNPVIAPTPGSGIVASSAPVVQQENNTTKSVNDMLAGYQDDGQYKAASDAYLKTLNDESAALEARRVQQEAGINSSFDTTRGDLINNQTNETGATTTGLARIGGYLGNSASSIGALVNLNQTHQREITALEGQRQAALQAARTAIEDKQFALAQSKAQEAKDAEKEIYSRKKDYLDTAFKIAQNDREQATADISNKTATYNLSSNQAGDIAASVAQNILAQKPTDNGAAIIQATAERLGIDPAILSGAVGKYQSDQNKQISTSILSFAKDYPDAGITLDDVNGADFTSVMQKVQGSATYKNATTVQKAQADKAVADAIAAQAANDPTSKSAEYSGIAELWASTGVKPTGVPAGAEGVIFQLAKQKAATNLGTGTIIDKATGLQTPVADVGGATIFGQITAAGSLLKAMSELQSFAHDVQTNPAGGSIMRAGKLVSLSSTDASRYQDIVNRMLSSYAQAKSGLAVSDKERANLAQQLPSLDQFQKYNDVTIQEFLTGIKQGLRSQLSATNSTLKGIDISTTPQEKEEDAKFDAMRAAVFDDSSDTSGSSGGGGSGSGVSFNTVEIPKTSGIAYNNNNPGNLKFTGQAGATKGAAAADGGNWAKFESPTAGAAALANQVNLDMTRGLTLAQFINKYAPPSSNNTSQYLTQATSTLGATAATPLSKIDINKLVAFIAHKESGTKLS